MNREQFEEQLKKLSADYQQISNDKDHLWLSISSKISETDQDPLTIREIALEMPLRTTFMRYAPAMLILLVIFGSGITAVSASQNTLPGNLLYPLQRAIESVREKTIIKSQNKIEFKIHKAEKRLNEINEMKALHATNESIAPTTANTDDYQDALLDAIDNFQERVENIDDEPFLQEKKRGWEKRLNYLRDAADKAESEDENDDQFDADENDAVKDDKEEKADSTEDQRKSTEGKED